MSSYKIYPTLHSEIRKGTVWSFYETDSNLIKIKNLKNKKSIVVAHRKIENNFIKIYKQSIFTNKSEISNENVFIIDEYYRNKLGVSKYDEVELKIKPVKSFVFWYKLSYLKNHPDEVVNITFWFALLTFVFTLFSYIIPYEKLIKIISHISLCISELIVVIFDQ